MTFAGHLAAGAQLPGEIRYDSAMPNHVVSKRFTRGVLTVICGAALMQAAPSGAFPSPERSPSAADAAPLRRVQLFDSPAVAEYKRRLAEYEEARAAYEAEASAYWNLVAEKRRARNAKRREKVALAAEDYVLDQPPAYEGPKRPINPNPEPEPEKPGRSPKYIPVLADFLAAARQHFDFVPQRPANEVEFKRAYVRAATAEGLTRDQIIRVFAFETGGNGAYTMQSGFASGRPDAHAISTAIGYNQLLTTNTVELIAEQGEHFVRVLTERAHALAGAARKAMDHKIAALKRMLALCRSVPDDWSQHEKIANTEAGWGVHAMVFDVDVGPLLQTHKLLTSVIFARERGVTRTLTAAELEMMNLTGDGTGLDMVTMPAALREQVPTSNFFQRGGYERNPVAIRHNTVARLFAVMNARMDSAQGAAGAKEMASVF